MCRFLNDLNCGKRRLVRLSVYVYNGIRTIAFEEN